MKYFSEAELKMIAEENSKTIVIREYENGCSKDIRREATPEEQENIFKILYAGLLAIDFNGKSKEAVQGVKNACEFMGHMFLPKNTNCYDTIYCVLWDFYEKNK